MTEREQSTQSTQVLESPALRIEAQALNRIAEALEKLASCVKAQAACDREAERVARSLVRLWAPWLVLP